MTITLQKKIECYDDHGNKVEGEEKKVLIAQVKEEVENDLSDKGFEGLVRKGITKILDKIG